MLNKLYIVDVRIVISLDNMTTCFYSKIAIKRKTKSSNGMFAKQIVEIQFKCSYLIYFSSGTW